MITGLKYSLKVFRASLFTVLVCCVGQVIGTAVAVHYGAFRSLTVQVERDLQFWASMAYIMMFVAAIGLFIAIYTWWCRRQCDKHFACMACIDADQHCCKHYVASRRSLVFWTNTTLSPSVFLIGISVGYLWSATSALMS